MGQLGPRLQEQLNLTRLAKQRAAAQGTPPGGGASPGTPVRVVARTSGSDSNPGTAALPWKTLSYALSNAPAGATIYLRGNDGLHTLAATVTKSGLSGLTVTTYP